MNWIRIRLRLILNPNEQVGMVRVGIIDVTYWVVAQSLNLSLLSCLSKDGADRLQTDYQASFLLRLVSSQPQIDHVGFTIL
jgi:hypothetical protein